MQYIIRLFSLLLISITACDPCNSPEIPFTFNTIESNLVNNAAEWIQPAASDTLPNEAVAFKIIIKDSIFPGYSSQESRNLSIQLIPVAHADECPQWFLPLNRMVAINITTLLPITENLHSHTDVTELFYALSGASSHSEHLYYTIDQTLENHQTRKYFEHQQEEVNFFLSIPVQMNKAQFKIDILMSDQTVLSTQTPLIHIINGAI